MWLPKHIKTVPPVGSIKHMNTVPPVVIIIDIKPVPPGATAISSSAAFVSPAQAILTQRAFQPNHESHTIATLRPAGNHQRSVAHATARLASATPPNHEDQEKEVRPEEKEVRPKRAASPPAAVQKEPLPCRSADRGQVGQRTGSETWSCGDRPLEELLGHSMVLLCVGVKHGGKMDRLLAMPPSALELERFDVSSNLRRESAV